MLEMSWITAILQLYSQVTVLSGNVIVKRINIRLFDLLALFHYILNLPRIYTLVQPSCTSRLLWRRDSKLVMSLFCVCKTQLAIPIFPKAL